MIAICYHYFDASTHTICSIKDIRKVFNLPRAKAHRTFAEVTKSGSGSSVVLLHNFSCDRWRIKTISWKYSPNNQLYNEVVIHGFHHPLGITCAYIDFLRTSYYHCCYCGENIGRRSWQRTKGWTSSYVLIVRRKNEHIVYCLLTQTLWNGGELDLSEAISASQTRFEVNWQSQPEGLR